MTHRQIARVRRAAIALVVVTGCRAESRAARVDSAGAAGGTAVEGARAASRKPSATPQWRVVAWEPYAGVDPGDLGIGVAFLTHAEDKGAAAGTDTLLLRSEPNETSAAVGAMLFAVGPNGVTQYSIAAGDSLRPNLVEHGYEESGVPFDSADASARWLRGILGFAADGTPRVGWIDGGARGVGTIRWAQQLADRPIFFPRPAAAVFFASPDSTRRLSVPDGGEDAYAIHPLEARGPWLRVRVVTPSDNCAESEGATHRTRTVWIRYLDERGRPNVWYYPRGC